MNKFLIATVISVILGYVLVWLYVAKQCIKNNFEFKSGSRRFVILYKYKVYKIPKFTNWVAFIRGINENLEERYWYSADGSRKRDPDRKWDMHLPLAEIYYADRFGFLVVMERLNTLPITSYLEDRTIEFGNTFFTTSVVDPSEASYVTDEIKNDIKQKPKSKFELDLDKLLEEVSDFSFKVDVNPSNVGYRKDRLIMLDYGYFGGTMDCYIGT